MKCYDPRDPEQDETNAATWRESTNPALIEAHITRRFLGPTLLINWALVAARANRADANETDSVG